MKNLLLCFVFCVFSCSQASPTQLMKPDGKDKTTFSHQFPIPHLNVNQGYNGIYYHGGKILLGTVNIYLIWYGNWSNDPSTISLVSDFINNLNGSSYANIQTTYYDANKNYLSNSINLAGSATDNYSRGIIINQSDIQFIVAKAVANGLPADDNAVYLVLSSQDVVEKSGFCSVYCGWHSFNVIGDKYLHFAFIGNPAACEDLHSCAVQFISPNKNWIADSMVNVLAHELFETENDGELTGWANEWGYESGDLCAWNFMLQYQVANGSNANVNLNGTDYLLQAEWKNDSGGKCEVGY